MSRAEQEKHLLRRNMVPDQTCVMVRRNMLENKKSRLNKQPAFLF